jgi:ABC-type transporter Mla subunit MlaD
MTTEERFDRVDSAIERLCGLHGTLTGYVLDFRQETATRLQTIDNRLDILSSTLASLDSRHPALTKAILDFGSLATQLQREQSRQKDTVTDLSTRVAKLEDVVPKLIDPAA